MFIRAFVVALAVLALVGCRDPLVDEPLPVGEEEEEPTDGNVASPMYVKGIDTLRIGQTAHFRAENVQGATDYRWLLVGGTGHVTGSRVPSDSLGRFFDITGREVGPVQLRVEALDEANAPLRVGSIHFEVSR